MEKIPTADLIQAALEMMRQVGKPLSKKRGRLYEMLNKETVRVLTSNDRKLHANADSPDGHAKLSIEGTDWILIAMPKVMRTPGEIESYLVPAREAVDAARRAHQEWEAMSSSTKGNTTWFLYFDSGSGAWCGYAEKWSKYRLCGEVSVSAKKENQATAIKTEVENAKECIAKAAGVPREAVRISIDFTA
jgi:hypothetical protein